MNNRRSNLPEKHLKAEDKPYKLTVLRSGALVVLMMILLVAAAGSGSLLFTTSIERSFQEMRHGTDQAIRVSELQSSWLAVTGLLDTFSVTRPTEETRIQIEKQLAEFNQQLDDIGAQSLGLTPEMIEENRQLTEQLQQVGIEMSRLVPQLYELVQAGRWGSALQLRQTTVASLQKQLDENLRQLNWNIQKEVSDQINEIQRLETIARWSLIIIVGVAVVLAAVIGWIARKRIIQPIWQLTAIVERITQRDLQPFTPLPQKDEIGDLSRAIAMMTDWLRESYETLERRVEERTYELEQRTNQLQVAAQIARDITATYNLDELLRNAVNLIRDRFNFYHAGIFLADERHEYAVLVAATGEAGEKMLAQSYRLKIGEMGMVGYVTQTGKPRIALDVGQDAVHYDNPFLPETRSEVALPLVGRGGATHTIGRVIGALDVQSREASAFNEESIAVLQIIADQLAIAIQNARLFMEVQESLREIESTYGRYDRQTWDRFTQSRVQVGYQYDGMGLTPIQQESVESLEAFDASADAPQPISMPLIVRGETIGSLDIWPREKETKDEDAYLLATVGSRISQVLESARLLQEAQRLALREQQINSISSQVRKSTNIETILQTTIRELGKNLGAARSYIQLGGNPIPDSLSSTVIVGEPRASETGSNGGQIQAEATDEEVDGGDSVEGDGI